MSSFSLLLFPSLFLLHFSSFIHSLFFLTSLPSFDSKQDKERSNDEWTIKQVTIKGRNESKDKIKKMIRRDITVRKTEERKRAKRRTGG